MSTGLVLSLEFGALGHSLVAATLSAVMTHRTDAVTDTQLESLLDQFRHASNPEARVHSARRLARSHEGRAVAALRASLADRDARVQPAAALALGEIADTSAEADLRSLLATSGVRLPKRVSHLTAIALPMTETGFDVERRCSGDPYGAGEPCRDDGEHVAVRVDMEHLQMIDEQVGVHAAPAGASTPSPSKASATDVVLVRRMLAGDEAAFADVVGRYHASLIRVAMAFVASPDVAEEVVQETWLAVLNGLSAFEGRSSLKSWIFSIVTNRAKTRGVREKRTIAFSELSVPGSDMEPAVDPERFASSGAWSTPPARWDKDSPEDQLLRREARTVMEGAIAELPPSQRAVVTLRDIEGLEAAEVCNVLGLSETNQRVLLHRARSKVRAALERYVSGA